MRGSGQTGEFEEGQRMREWMGCGVTGQRKSCPFEHAVVCTVVHTELGPLVLVWCCSVVISASSFLIDRAPIRFSLCQELWLALPPGRTLPGRTLSHRIRRLCTPGR